MKDRIQLILKSKNLSSSQFADEIQVQRSSISHILSGRNKPSLDFVSKILSSYPELNSDWLLFGKGQMIKQEKAVQKYTEEIKPDLPAIEKKEEVILEKETSPILQQNITDDKNLTIEKIVIFYSNGTFEEYNSK